MYSPWQRYRRDLDSAALVPDAHQERLVLALERIYQALAAAPEPVTPRWWHRWRRASPVKGLYAYGGVGRGKTFLVNRFHAALPLRGKLRIHFHRFMARVHSELAQLPQQEDPLRTLADRIADQNRVICFDEFHVSDIADAMILGRLLSRLFEQGVTLVATSNIAPDDLYHGGLQRAGFLPAIEAIKAHTLALHVAGETDYRLRVLARDNIYHWPLDEAAPQFLQKRYRALEPDEDGQAREMVVNGRGLQAVRLADGIAWFEFVELCDTPRSSSDYIELARQFHTVLVANVPVLDDLQKDQARRFIHLIDEFYDRNVNVLVSAAAPPGQLYRGKSLAGPFRRTASRLQEMQSLEYLARRHWF